jgi:hypothetical protein
VYLDEIIGFHARVSPLQFMDLSGYRVSKVAPAFVPKRICLVPNPLSCGCHYHKLLYTVMFVGITVVLLLLQYIDVETSIPINASIGNSQCYPDQ